MKTLFTIFSLFFLLNANAQYFISYIQKVNYQEEMTVGDVTVVFEGVLVDSRCPKAVTCVRAGEAKILVSIYEGDELIEEKELIFQADGSISEETNLIYSTEELRLLAVGIEPYPVYPDSLKKIDYSIEIKVN